MNHENQAELARVNRELMLTHIIGAPGVLLIGLGFYGIFGTDGNAFHPIFDSTENCLVMLAVGFSIAAWEIWRVLGLTKKQRELRS